MLVRPIFWQKTNKKLKYFFIRLQIIVRMGIIDLTANQPKRSPISISSSSAAGGGGGATFFYSFLPPFSLVSALAAGAAAAAGATEAEDPPKLKKELMSLPWRAFANNLGQ